MELLLLPYVETRVTPALLTLSHMLALPALELQQLVRQELSENPALEELELEDESLEGLDDEGLLRLLEQRSQAAGEDPGQTGADDDIDPLLFVAAPQTLAEYILSDLRTSLPSADYPIARLLVESLDEHGFLADTPADLAATLGVETERVLAVMQRLRDIGPPGIATTDVQSCLLAQLEHLAAAGMAVPTHATLLVSAYFDALGARRDRFITQQSGVGAEHIETVRVFLQQHCYPYPAQLVRTSGAGRTAYSQPDVVITHRDDDTFGVEVLHSPRRLLRLNPLYRELARQASTLDSDERVHVQDYLARARTFLATLRQRESTLQAISEAVVVYQDAFLRQGVRALLPLTRAEIAAEVGVHESTVSRATAGKTVLLPNSRLLAFAEFFVAARPVQDVLRELVANETTPLSDGDLARLLTERGHPVARRTVAKYRSQMHILPSTLRRHKPA